MVHRALHIPPRHHNDTWVPNDGLHLISELRSQHSAYTLRQPLRPQCTRKEKKQGFNSGDSPIGVGLRDNYHLKLDQVVHHKTRRFLRRKKVCDFSEGTWPRFGVFRCIRRFSPVT